MKFVPIAIALAAVSCVFGQTAALNGRVTDETGAVVPAAKVTINGAGISAQTIAADADGFYSFMVCRLAVTLSQPPPLSLPRRKPT